MENFYFRLKNGKVIKTFPASNFIASIDLKEAETIQKCLENTIQELQEDKKNKNFKIDIGGKRPPK